MDQGTKATELLYLGDSLRFAFEARVLGHKQWSGREALVLDQTAFYPESGGQAADRGMLADLAVIDVQKDKQGVIYHLIEGRLPPVGTQVAGQVDESRRRLHMAQHTGQHMLSQALTRLFDAPTRSSHLGESGCTIDVGGPVLSLDKLFEAEALVNEMIDRDLTVRAWVPAAEELTQLTLRRRAKVSDNIRVVAIGDFDLIACGGTHCTQSSQVGLVLLQSAERYKGMTRVAFAAGQKARRQARAHGDALRAVARHFKCRAEDAADHAQRSLRQSQESQNEIKSLRMRLSDELAHSLIASQTAKIISADLGGVDQEVLRAVGKKIIQDPLRVALLCAQVQSGLSVLAMRGADSQFDCQDFLGQLFSKLGGQGGGRPDFSQGRLPAGTDWLSQVAQSISQKQ